MEPGDAEHGDVVVLVERDDLRVEEGAVVAVDVWRVDSGNDVGVRDDEAVARDPARAFDPEPAGVADDAHDAERRAAHAGRVEHGRVGRLDSGRRAGEGGERVDLRERVDQAVRRQLLR